MSALDAIPLKRIDGSDASLGDWAGQVRLVVNVASACGLTPQYEGLEKLYSDRKARGLVVLGFPANDFAGQEPGTNEQIAEFCTTKFGASFPMFEKLVATGPDKHPLYAELIAAAPAKTGDAESFRTRLRGHGIAATSDPEVLWNFEKFVIGRDGKVVGRFTPDTAPDDPALLAAIDEALGE